MELTRTISVEELAERLKAPFRRSVLEPLAAPRTKRAGLRYSARRSTSSTDTRPKLRPARRGSPWRGKKKMRPWRCEIARIPICAPATSQREQRAV